MARKMKIEKTLENLRKLNEAAKKEVELLEFELAEIQTQLEMAKEREITTADAIAALTGAPTLKKMLQVLQSKETLTPTAHNANPNLFIDRDVEAEANLPAPEEGFRWARNNNLEWVLIPEIAQNAEIAASESLLLPAVLEDETFSDKPEDLI